VFANQGHAVGQVTCPYFMCESTDGGIMVCDTGSKRIQEFFLDGRPPRVVIQFNDGTYPMGIARCDNGAYIVADNAKHRVMRIDGRATIKWTVGTPGNGKDQFNSPCGVAILLDGRVVVADAGNNRLQVLNADTGVVVGTITRNDGVVWSLPLGITVDDKGLIYVAEQSAHRVVVINVDGTVVRTLGSRGNGQGQLTYPWGVTVDGKGNVLVGDEGNKRIVVFRPDGTSIHIPTPGNAFDVLITSTNRLIVSGGHFVAEY